MRQGLAVLVGFALVAAGCGDSGSKTKAASPAATPAAEASGAPAGAAPTSAAAAPEASNAPGVAPSSGSAAVPDPAPASGKGTTVASAVPRKEAAAAGPGGSQSAGAAPGKGSVPNPGATPAPGPTPGPGEPAATPVAGCAKALPPIIIGSVGNYSGVAGATIAPGAKAAQAWAASLNATGGLKCHPVKYIIVDDGGDPARHQSEVQRLVEQEKVIAFVYQGAVLTGYSTTQYLNSKRVPVIGSEMGSQWFYENPMFFPQGTSGHPAMRANMAALATAGKGKKKVGILSCLEAQFCTDLGQRGPEDAKHYGLQVVYTGRASLTQPDFTANCLDAQRQGVEIFLVAEDSASIHRVAKSCQSVGFRPMFGAFFTTLADDFKDDAALDGVSGMMPSMPWFAGDPGVQAYVAGLKKFAPNTAPGASSVLGWVAAKVFEKAAQNIGEQPSSDAVLRGLWSMKNDDIGGLTQPLSFTEGQNAPQTRCYWVVQADKGKWTSPNGGVRTCE